MAMVTPYSSSTQKGTIYITAPDLDRLLALVDGYRAQGREDRGTLQRLADELDRAEVVDEREVAADVVTLDSQVCLVDRDSGEEMTFTLVLPSRSNADQGRRSVLAPLGMAVLGYRVGDDIEWEVPAGRRRLQVRQVTYQPQAAARNASRRASGEALGA